MAIINCPECGRDVSDRAPTCPGCGTPIAPTAPERVVLSPPPEKKKAQIGCFGSGCLILIVVGVIGAIVGGNSGSSSGGSSSPSNTSFSAPPPPSRAEQALRNLSISKWSWHKGGFDSVMIATFTFKNDNDFPVKDITIRCTHTAPSGTMIDDNTRTIFERVEAHKKHTVRDFSMGFIHSQASQSSCEVTGVVPAE